MQAIDVRLVQSSWEQVLPIADIAAELFYAKLFELDRSLEALFAATDMAEQQRKLMQMLTVAVRGLNRIEELMPALEAMGQRHVGYGVTDDHYDTVGAALIWTLARGLGDAFTTETRAAWIATYQVISGAMIRGARQKAA